MVYYKCQREIAQRLEEVEDMKIKEMIKKVEEINYLSFELGLEKEVKLVVDYNNGSIEYIRTYQDYLDFIKKYEVQVEAQEILNNKNFTKIKDYYQLADVFYIGEYSFCIELRVRIIEN